MITTAKSGISKFIQLCVDNGLRHVVCSPGSRNAPLVISMDQHPDLTTYVIHDERSAGFYALGLAIQLDQPVAVVCTSGSAVVNYYPAVTEAYYQCVPLIVISADRPVEWVNHGDGQTIVQKGVFDNHIHGFYSVPEEEEKSMNDEVSRLFDAALVDWRGPIHFNCPLSEPLYETVEAAYEEPKKVVHSGTEKSLSDSDLDTIVEGWKSKSRKMILCGQMKPNPRLNRLLEILASDPTVAVLVENTSNLQSRLFNHCIDRSLATISRDELLDFQPDLLITIGGAIVSKRIKGFLRSIEGLEHWRVGMDFPKMDTYRSLKKSFEVDAELLIDVLTGVERLPMESNFNGKWKQKDIIAKDHAADFISGAEYSDLTVFDTILDFLPEDTQLHMSNSSVVRYCQLFDPIKNVRYYCNRGTSGIDGSTSTACGVALTSKDKLNVLITGDVSFFYDSNALWSEYLGPNLRIILINNKGGGIFRIIDGPAGSDQLEKYFEAQHDHSASHLCSAFGLDYFEAKSLDDVESILPEFYNVLEGPKLLEIFTPATNNPEVLKSYFEHLS